ncbi:GntR family transcriptional regulator [Herbaspirillum huttiense]|uniref:GntR family transcriptional regulator n=1 Tax=Herbaspirillum huttiense TaxID=863372 RepID=UPI003B3A061D
MLDQTAADARLPLYLQLRDQLAAQIRAQKWQPGQAIPSEAELSQTYQVAVGTVRRAVETLMSEGLVERTHGRGTFVRKARFDNSLFRFFRFESADGRPLQPTSVIVSRKVIEAPRQVAEALHLKTHARVIELLRLRKVDGQPVLAENIYLCAQRFKALAGKAPEDFGDLLYPLYERECGLIVASARETLTVETVTAAQAKLLGLKEKTPVVVIERTAFGSDGAPLEWRQSRGAGSKFRYSAEIR